MEFVFKGKNNCCGCGICELNCSQHAISMRVDEEGFRYPVIDSSRCIDCGKCISICTFAKCQSERIVYDEPIDNEKSIYIARNKDKNTIIKSRSGGIFTALSDNVLNEGGYVCGCILDKELKAVHIICNDELGRNQMRGSKYVESELSINFYNHVHSALKKNKKVLFSGTPCQSAAIKSYFSDYSENLICVSVLCHGVSSPKVFRQYIKYQENNSNKACVHFEFRNKEKYGWKAHVETLIMHDDNGKSAEVDSDIYAQIYYTHLSLRPSCYFCPYKTQNHPSDIAIGDCWGIEACCGGDGFDGIFNDNMGASIVIPNTTNGKEFLKNIYGELEYKKLNMTEKLFQPALHVNYAFNEVERTKFWSDFNTDSTSLFMKYSKSENELSKYKGRYMDPRDHGVITVQMLGYLLEMYEEDKKFDFLIDNYITDVAIYGFGFVGKHLYRTLIKKGINVCFAIDKNADQIDNLGVQVYNISQKWEQNHIGAIIVTPVKYFYEIESELYKRAPQTHIVSLETVLTYGQR